VGVVCVPTAADTLPPQKKTTVQTPQFKSVGVHLKGQKGEGAHPLRRWKTQKGARSFLRCPLSVRPAASHLGRLHILELGRQLARLVHLHALHEGGPQGHVGAAELAAARAAGDVGQALGARADGGLGVQLLQQAHQGHDDQEVDDEADDDEAGWWWWGGWERPFFFRGKEKTDRPSSPS